MDKPRVLIVDDESSTLRSLRRGLRRHFKDWEFRYEQSAEQALLVLDAFEPWVVISDKRMPKVDGIQFLSQVKQRTPLAVRILLSGETDADTALPALGVAHLMLPKPFEMDDLVDALHAAECLRSLPITPDLKEEIGCISSLPVLPAVYRELTEYINQTDEPSNDRIAAIVEQDTAILSKVLQLANSAFFGFSTTTNSAQDAVFRLGQDMLTNLVLFSGLFKQDSSDNTSKHTVVCHQAETVAEIIRALAARMDCNRQNQNQHHVIGLLHNVGGLISGEPGPSRRNAIISAYLLKLWGFEKEIVSAVLNQLEPKTSDDPLTLRLHAAIIIEASRTQGLDPLDNASGLAIELLGQEYQQAIEGYLSQ